MQQLLYRLERHHSKANSSTGFPPALLQKQLPLLMEMKVLFKLVTNSCSFSSQMNAENRKCRGKCSVIALMTCAGRSEGWRWAWLRRGVLIHKQESHILLPASRISSWRHWEPCCYPVRSDVPSRTGLAWYQRLRFPGRHSVLCSQRKSLRFKWWFYQIPCTTSSSPNLVICITITRCTHHSEILMTSPPALLSWYCMDYRA